MKTLRNVKLAEVEENYSWGEDSDLGTYTLQGSLLEGTTGDIGHPGSNSSGYQKVYVKHKILIFCLKLSQRKQEEHDFATVKQILVLYIADYVEILSIRIA